MGYNWRCQVGWRAAAMSWDCHRCVTEKWCACLRAVWLYQRCTESHGFCVIMAKIYSQGIINLLHMGWKGCNCLQTNSHSDGVCFICVCKVSARHYRSIEPQRRANKQFVELNAPTVAEKMVCIGFLIKWLIKLDLIFNPVTTANTIVRLNIRFHVKMAQVND